MNSFVMMRLLALMSEYSFGDFRSGLAVFMAAVLGLAAVVTLVMVVYEIFRGDRDSVRKLVNWLLILLVGFVIFAVFGGLSDSVF